MNVAPLIQFENVGFRYPKQASFTLENINFSINKNEYVAFLGTSGSGKSTILSLIGLMNMPTKGAYYLLDTPVEQLTNQSLSLLKNREIGYVFQNFNLLTHLTSYQNVCLPLTYNDEVSRKEYQARVQEALQLVGMQGYEKRFPSQLSGGQQQRVAIARAMINRPSLILADEPTGNLDSKNANQIYDLLDRLHAMGNTVCLITHDSHFASRAQRHFEVEDGTII